MLIAVLRKIDVLTAFVQCPYLRLVDREYKLEYLSDDRVYELSHEYDVFNGYTVAPVASIQFVPFHQIGLFIVVS